MYIFYLYVVVFVVVVIAENVLFWNAVRAYDITPTLQHACEVYDTYIDESSPLQVNLPSHIHQACTQTYQQAQTQQVGTDIHTLFDEARQESKTQTKHNIFVFSTICYHVHSHDCEEIT